MVRRWIRLSRYSAVISAADSRRTPPSIFAIMSLAWSLIGSSRSRIPLLALDHTHGLAFGSRDRSRGHDRELDAQAGRLPELLGGAPTERLDLGMIGGEAAAPGDQLGRRLDLDLEPGQGRRAIDDHLVVRRQLLDGEQGSFDLRGIEVDALDDEHVVRAALDARHPRRGAAAAAGLQAQGRDIAGAIANERHRALGQGGEDELPFPAGRERFSRHGIDDLRKEVIVGDMKTLARLAFAGDTGPDDLGE